LTNLLPEVYANENLKEALKIKGTDEECIHDARVYLRKYYDILSSFYPIYENSECLYLAKEAISALGKVRDMDICQTKDKKRDQLALRTLGRVKKLKGCYLNRVCCSRLLIYNNILKIYVQISDINDFHELRKKVRKARNLVESLGFESKEIKVLAKKMGDIRDDILRLECKGLKPYEINIVPYRDEAKKTIGKILLIQNEFHHFL